MLYVVSIDFFSRGNFHTRTYCKEQLLTISFTDNKKYDQKAPERHNCTSPECDFSSVVYIDRVAVTTKNSTDLLGDKFVDVHIVG